MPTTEKPATRLMKIGLSPSVAKHIAGKGISSVMQLAGIPSRELELLLKDIDLGAETVKSIKQRAAIMKSLVDNHLVTVRGQVASSYKALASTNVNNNIINFHEGMESYPEMFGSPDYPNDTEFDSLISPAAYLVDLMRYINEYIQQPSSDDYNPLQLKSRRPDIWNLHLDKENTVNEVQYLELVNEILETKLQNEGRIQPDGSISQNPVGNALQYMAETIFPFNLPFNTPLEKTRKYLEALQTKLYDVYKTFRMDEQAQAREYIQLSPEQAAYLTTPLPNPDSLNLAYGNIQTQNPKPHFKGIVDDTNPGSLNNAEIFMNQVGFTETSQLKSLFYQDIINTDSKNSGKLLDGLFINQASAQSHLAYIPAVTTGADWADGQAWTDVSYYSTIQKVTAGNDLYLIVRTAKGIDTWKYDHFHRNWVQLTAATPAWSDDAGWNKPEYYTTIHAIAGEGNIFLSGRFSDGLHLWEFDTTGNTWSEKTTLPQMTDAQGWGQPQYYQTIRTVYANKFVFVVGRFKDGIHTWFFNPLLNSWSDLSKGPNDPAWTDANGWDSPSCYLSIRLVVIQGTICLIGKSPTEVETYVIYFQQGLIAEWMNGPTWDSDWDQPYWYMTIQTCIVGDWLYLIVSGLDGIEVYCMEFNDGVYFTWFGLATNDMPNWNPKDWEDPSNYLTIKTAALGNNIILTARSATGINTWKLDTTAQLWSALETNFPTWSDAAGWNDPSYYSSIHSASFNNTVLLFGCTKTAIDTWRLDPAQLMWVKDPLVKAVIMLSGSSGNTVPTMAVFDRLNRFIRFAGILGWLYKDLDWALLAARRDDIDDDAIAEIKNLQWIMDTLNIPLWKATAFWHDIKTYGEGSGPVSQAPFDIIFNQPGPSPKPYHPVYPPNPDYQDEVIMWQPDGRSAFSHEIMVLLMGALNLDARSFKALIDYLQGSDDMALNVPNLSMLYRYALLANSLKLSVPGLLILLEFLGWKGLSTFQSTDIIRIIRCNQWMVENKLNVYQLNYIINNVTSKFIDTGFDLDKVPALLKSLSEAAAQWYLNAKQLQFEPLMNEDISRVFYNTLLNNQYLDDRGIILTNDFSFSDISDCFFCGEVPFAGKDQFTSICEVGNTAPTGAASRVLIPFNPNNVPPGQRAWNGCVCMWFKYDGAQTKTCTLYSLYNTGNKNIITRVQITGSSIVLTAQNGSSQTVYQQVSDGKWHFLVISYKQQYILLDKRDSKTSLTQLQIPAGVACGIALGEDADAFTTAVADLKVYETDMSESSNHWPLNEGQGAVTARDIAGDLNGEYTGNSIWRIVYNAAIPDGANYFNAQYNLKDNFPANVDQDNTFLALWKTIVNLRNILNNVVSAQKSGTLQKLSDYFQTNKDLSIYADYTAVNDKFPNYVQTLLAYRFSLSWQEFSMDLDQPRPFINSYLISQFAANRITLSPDARISRLTDKDGNPVDRWVTHGQPTDAFSLSRMDDALDVYKLLQIEPEKIYPTNSSFLADSNYAKFHFDKGVIADGSSLYFSDSDDQFAALFKRGDYVRLAIHELPGTEKDVVSRINSFISDLGLLLFTAKTLKLSDAEFACIVNNPDRFFAQESVTATGIFSLQQLQSIVLFRDLNRAYAREDMSFADYFSLPDDISSLVNYVPKLTQWDAQGLRQLSEWNCTYQQFAEMVVPGIVRSSVISVGAGGSYAIAGFPLSNVTAIYQLNGKTWEELPVIRTPHGGSSFGKAVAIQEYVDGSSKVLRATIADPSVNDGAGAVYVYEYNYKQKQWGPVTVLTAHDANAGDAFGSALAVYQDTIAIGAPGASNGVGKAYIFKYASGQWNNQAIQFNVAAGDTAFGSFVGLHDDVVTIGSAKNAYVFRIVNAAAVQVVPPVPCTTPQVVTNGDFVIISSDSNPAIQYIANINSGGNLQPQPLNNFFNGACTVAMEDDTVIINDSTNTCFVYAIWDKELSYRHHFNVEAASAGPWQIALGNGNLVIGSIADDRSTALFYGAKHDVNWFGFADSCFRLADKLGVSVGTLLGFTRFAELELEVRTQSDDSKPSADNDAIYRAYERYADSLASALTMGRTPDEWNDVYSPLRDKFLEMERDALAGYMIFSLRNAFTDITGINDLYELLLIDVGSAGCRTISKLKAALNSLQLYIERCRMQLEPYVTMNGGDNANGSVLNAADVEWSWMSHYRIWEANREVFLFPENYFDPTLRKDKTTPYADLQNKLTQSNLTNTNATDAFQSYFHDLETLTGLTVVATCMGYISNFVNGKIIIKNTFFIFAKTKNRNEGYYYRTAEAVLPTDAPGAWVNWSNWEKMNISINADGVACVYAGGRPYIFWVEFTKQQVSGTDSEYKSDKSFYYETKAYYSFLNANGQWANPHDVPDPGNQLDFSVTATGSPFKVNLPDSPVIDVLSSFMDVANLSISFTVTGGTATPASPLIVPIDDILDLYERYMWKFDTGFSDLRSQYTLGPDASASIVPGTGIFSGRNVLSVIAGAIYLPAYFNTWFNHSFSFGMWINFPALDANAHLPILVTDGGTNQFWFEVQATGNPEPAAFLYFGIGAGPALESLTTLVPGKWHFIVFRYDATTSVQSIFIDGARDGRQMTNTLTLYGDDQYYFSLDPPGGSVGCQAADIFFIHAPMTDEEILSTYKEYTVAFSDAESYEWMLDGDFNEVNWGSNMALIPSAEMDFVDNSTLPGGINRKVLSLSLQNQQYATLPEQFNTFLNQSFTIGIWVYFNDQISQYQVYYPVLGAYTSGDIFFFAMVYSGVLDLLFDNQGMSGKTQLASGAYTNKWLFMVFVYDAGLQTQNVFLNGVLDNSTTFAPSPTPYTGSSPFTLAAFGTAINNNCLMANLLLVNKALSASDIRTLYSDAANTAPYLPDYVDLLNTIQTSNAKRIQQLNFDLFTGGPDYLYAKNSVNITADDLSSAAPYGKYMWELFYHIPMLTGQLLSSNQQFNDAKRWYEYIFNPTAADTSNDRFWQLAYFRSLGKPEDIVDILTDSAQKDKEQVLIYDLDPFDPEAIAYLRPGAFEKKTVVNYIQNLIDWADSLFSQYTWESITQAEMLYVLAKELLGKKPDISGSFAQRTPMTIAQIEQEYPGDIPQFVIDIENMQPAIHPGVQYTPRLSASVYNFYFGIPENDELPSLQDLVNTRLYEIRNCLNILGQKQSLALFEPPINPMMLVAAGAAGLNLATVPISYAAAIPHYRFNKMIAYAKEVTEKVVDFGRQVLIALEKNDEEQLAVIRTVQERSILDLTTSIKQKAIEEAMGQALVLNQSLASANERVAYYTRMLATPVSILEGLALGFNLVATAIEVPATELHVAAVAGHLIPTVFGFADGDFNPGGAIESAAAALHSGSNIVNSLANMTAVSASYERRAEEWELQLKMAQFDVTSITTQKAINNIQLQNATAELAIHQQNMTNNQNMRDFYAGKFTNRELYQWMIDQVSSVYYQAFQSALDLAKKAQVAYQFELNKNESFISYGYWDSTRRGLLAGEKLVADLGRLEKAYVDNNVRYLEIQKIVSLKNISPTSLDKLIKTGTCIISLTEQLYDWDFPGHYNRKIKTISISIPAIVGPYQSIRASLVQQSNKIVAQPDLNTVKFLVSKDNQQQPLNGSMRVNWRPNQQIAISKASGDNGMFELNFNDERYLPFEGTGVVSDWQLSIPQATNAFDLTTISDVILYINYTAQDGGAEFGQQVLNLLKSEK